MKPFKHLLAILLIVSGSFNFAQYPTQKPTDKPPTTQDSIAECITLKDMLKQIEARDKRLEATKQSKNNTMNSISQDVKNNQPNAEVGVVYSEDYNNLLTLELPSRVTGFEASKAIKMHPMQGMLSESLMYYWENGREIVIEKSASNRKRKTHSRVDFAKLMWVDSEADMESFLFFIGLDKHPELSKVNDVGESAYWNSKNQNLQMYYNGVSFMLPVIVSFDADLNKEKTIELANLIVEERIK
ncbi:hypothetical protein ESY86_08745 [Subsaximicrobium wynnwilliamsii]|jgi:hypothetical protein|uniref:DUF3298 domain-containing protein n=1 Tax=Subsaximicrobium wynnwilliamsii TaxID=291179 RepID=A0A5C6ZJY8_9FLAO|nr:hypothetical protein [Subsaximicrobium wynnwilliamsii]TXD83657.1 hypothetical protein ESY87_08460 [Subsaximicrobium wynnwilliamsii]TXD89458.1 hypothetical protein ESY86_08745 [Subsaximicrobium wynnwilliamsii]TXE03494.1 hypothetical protein ESY88_07485 [Subsaximicrobium wynnwilliamsii]